MQWTSKAVDFLTEVGYDPEFGARPVKRAIQRYVLNDLSKKILSEAVLRDKPILIDANDDELIFSNKIVFLVNWLVFRCMSCLFNP